MIDMPDNELFGRGRLRSANVMSSVSLVVAVVATLLAKGVIGSTSAGVPTARGAAKPSLVGSSPQPLADRDAEQQEQAQALRRWRLEQQQYYQLRSTFLSEALASRGIPMSTMRSVSTVEGSRPEPVDWDCAYSTTDDPKTCLYSFDAQLGTKVIAPIHTDQWISLNALNRLRRVDPTKVEPMWHRKYLILQSWFGDTDTSLLQHVGIRGWVISTLLLDRRIILRTVLCLGIISIFFTFLPLLEFAINSLLISEFFWSKYNNWGRIAHAALPFKLLVAQMTWKFLSKRFDQFEGRVRDSIVDMECQLLEGAVPVTVGQSYAGRLGVDRDIDTDQDEEYVGGQQLGNDRADEERLEEAEETDQDDIDYDTDL